MKNKKLDKKLAIPVRFSSCAVALWLSVAVALAVILFMQFSHYRFFASNYTYRLFSIAGLVATVLSGMGLLLLSRKSSRILPQSTNVEEKIRAYRNEYQRQYWEAFVVQLTICATIVFSNNKALIMLLLVHTLILFFLLPNAYKAKHDLALSDEDFNHFFEPSQQ